MKILFSGDHHFDSTKRWDECRFVHNWMVALAERERPALFISTGDIYERASTPAERMAVALWLTSMAEVCPVLVVKGNHDQSRDCELLAKLRTRHPVIVEEGAGVHVIGGVAIAAVAWPERARVLESARELGCDPDNLAQDALGHVLRGLGGQLRAVACDREDGQPDLPRIAVGHFMCDGAVTSLGQPLLGQPMNVTLAQLALLDVPLVVMGHIHKPQEWTHGDMLAMYTGSPFRTTYGELEEKSVLLVEYDTTPVLGPVMTSVDRIATPCAPMHLVVECWGAWPDAGGGETVYGFGGGPEAHLDPNTLDGALIRMRYEVDADQRDAAREVASAWADEWRRCGAAEVKVEEEVATSTRARAPEVAQALTLGDKLHALWRARSTTPEPPRAERLITMAHTLSADQEAS